MIGLDIKINKAFFLILTYVVIFPAIAAYYCWQKAIELIGPNRSSMFIQLMPLFSALMAIVIFKEKFQLFHLLSIFYYIGIYLSNRKPMIKVAVLDDYQSAFKEIVEIEKLKNKFDFKIFNEAFSDENEALGLEEFEVLLQCEKELSSQKFIRKFTKS